MPQFLFFLLVQLSLFALGTLLVTLSVLAVKRPPYWWAYLVVKTGIGGIIAILLGLILPHRIVQPGVLTYLYLTCVAAVGSGVIFVCRDIIRRTVQAKEFGNGV